MKNWRAIFPIFLSFAIAVTGGILLYNWINAQRAPQEIVKVESEAIPVAVAAVNLPWGTKLKPEMVKTTPFLKESLPPGHFSNYNDLKDRVIVTPIKLNEPISEHKLAPIDVSTGGVSAILKPGTRAIAVKGDKVIGISGFINPGNRVDVIVTVTNPNSKDVIAKIILDDLLVLATGTQIQKNEKGEPMPVDVYTLEVTPEQAEKLALASTQGRLQFALRNLTDTENAKTSGVTIAQILNSSGWAEREIVAPPVKAEIVKKAEPVKKVKITTAPKKKRWAPRRSVTVEVIRGTELTKKKLSL
jgi:pilus assembly protein CpaB